MPPFFKWGGYSSSSKTYSFSLKRGGQTDKNGGIRDKDPPLLKMGGPIKRSPCYYGQSPPQGGTHFSKKWGVDVFSFFIHSLMTVKKDKLWQSHRCHRFGQFTKIYYSKDFFIFVGHTVYGSAINSTPPGIAKAMGLQSLLPPITPSKGRPPATPLGLVLYTAKRYIRLGVPP